MQEKYLHYLWRMKRLDFSRLHLANLNYSSVYIEEVGWYNQDSGPDFFNGSVIIDNIRWFGNIEIHIKSSDWHLHNHHLDDAYNNVILHVVYEHDKEVEVNGKILPTIELKPLIDLHHLRHYDHLTKNSLSIPCARQVSNHKMALLQQIDVCVSNRIERKGLELLKNKKYGRDKRAIFFQAILKAAGGRANKLPMIELSQLLPFPILEKERYSALRIESLIFGTAGILPHYSDEDYPKQLSAEWSFLKAKHQLSEMNAEAWKFGGMRPNSFPTTILSQIIGFLLQVDWRIVETLSAKEIIETITNLSTQSIHPYWKSHYTFFKECKPRSRCFSPLFKQNLLINGIVPYFVALKHLTGDYTFSDKAIEILELLPAEQNNVIKQWQEIGIKLQNSLESQGLLELKNEFCNLKKCLSCKVGSSILERKSNENKKTIPLKVG